MNRKTKTQSLTTTAMLIAIAVAIPIFMPFKIIIEPASYTLASHVPVSIAMFISVPTALCVALGSTVGFFLAGFPPMVIARAASHLIFSGLGAYYLSKHTDTLTNAKNIFFFNLIIGILHGTFELLSVLPFYMVGAAITSNFFYTVVVLVGLGTVIHSMVDFYLALAVCKPINKQIGLTVSITPKSTTHTS